MKSKKVFGTGIVIVAVLASAVLLGACGSRKEEVRTAFNGVPANQAAPAGLNACAACHADQTKQWLTHKHANLITPGDLNSAGNPAKSDPAWTSACATCHDPQGDSLRLSAGWTGNTPRPVVGCDACHAGGGEHFGQGTILLTNVPSNPADAAASDQFNTCVACHQLYNGTSNAADASGESILANHAAVPGDTRLNTGTSATTLFFVKKADADACTVCHTAHRDDSALIREYAEGGMGDPLALAWVTTDWKYTNAANPSGDRNICQRCHTSTGFKNFANNQSAYNPANNDFSYLLGTDTTATNDQKESLYCWACHTSSKGALRNPGPYTANYDNDVFIGLSLTTSTAFKYDAVSHTYPDQKGSNICIPCHAGRRTGESIKYVNQQAGMTSADFSNFGFINDHHFTAAGTLFGTGGYGFGDRSYEDPVFYVHKKIGTDEAPNTGSNGPCVGCHMSRPETHLFVPIDTVNGSMTGTITSVATTLCNNCHVGNEAQIMSPGMLERQKALLKDTLYAFNSQFEKQDLYVRGTSFARVRDTQVISSGTVTAVNGNPVIRGISTTWLTTLVEPGDLFRIDNDWTNTWYTILTVDSATQITLTAPYAGASTYLNTSGNGFAYQIKKTETVSIPSGGTIVTGTGTNWVAIGAKAGDKFRVNGNGTSYSIASVDSDTQLTLSSLYSGATVTNAPYTLRNGGTVSVVYSSKTVTGTGTNWINEDVVGGATTGDYFRVDNDGTTTWYRIAARTATTLTLTTAYSGATAAGVTGTVIRSASSRNWLSPGDTDGTGNTTGKNNMGAALNRYMLDTGQEPGAFAHNRYYVKRLLYDSIDWLDDGALNYSVGATLNALPSTTAYKANAMSYLLPNGVFPYSFVERP